MATCEYEKNLPNGSATICILEHCECFEEGGHMPSFTPTFGDQERKDILELDELSDASLKATFGYTDAGIENLRQNAKDIREGA